MIDFRGFGESEGDPTDLLPSRWLEDLEQRGHVPDNPDDIDAKRHRDVRFGKHRWRQRGHAARDRPAS